MIWFNLWNWSSTTRSRKCENHRTIIIMSYIFKDVLIMVHSCTYRDLEQNILDTHFCFRNIQYSTFDTESTTLRYICIIQWLQKAFDKAKHQTLIEILKRHSSTNCMLTRKLVSVSRKICPQDPQKDDRDIFFYHYYLIFVKGKYLKKHSKKLKIASL